MNPEGFRPMGGFAPHCSSHVNKLPIVGKQHRVVTHFQVYFSNSPCLSLIYRLTLPPLHLTTVHIHPELYMISRN